ncbi:MAG: hypothetical protein AAGL10_03400 [Pseudomonadota bacterium]
MTFQSDAGLFAHTLDLAGDRVLLVQMSEADYRQSSFLDNRLLQPVGQTNPARSMQWAGWDELEEASQSVRNDAQFVFHIGHVGSTLIARLLGEARGTLCLREPQILRQFAELHALEGQPHSPWPPGLFKRRLDLAVSWLSRTFSAEQRALVKATSFVSDIAPQILSGKRKAIYLTLTPERYVQTILAGEASRQELAALSGARLQRLNRRLLTANGTEPISLWGLDEAKRAAMAWACEMTALTATQSDNIQWIDFDAFLAEPATKLTEIAEFLNISISLSDAKKLTSGPIMKQYSKAPEHGYSAQLREDVLAQAAQSRGKEISSALQWLDKAAKSHEAIAAALEHA